LIARGHHGLIVTAPESATGPAETAEAMEVELGALVHSEVFLLGDEPILLLVSAAHRVDPERTGARLEGTLIPAPPHLVMRYTGQLPGSVANCGPPAAARGPSSAPPTPSCCGSPRGCPSTWIDLAHHPPGQWTSSPRGAVPGVASAR
jgi:hypothetical protein